VTLSWRARAGSGISEGLVAAVVAAAPRRNSRFATCRGARRSLSEDNSMARKARGGSSGRNFGRDLNHGSKRIWISGLIIAAVAAAGVGIGFHKRTPSKATVPQALNTPAAKAMRASPEALEVLTQLRNRYGSVSQRQTNSVRAPALGRPPQAPCPAHARLTQQRSSQLPTRNSTAKS